MRRIQSEVENMKKLNSNLLHDNVKQAACYDLDNCKVFGSAYWVWQNGETVLQHCVGTVSPEGDAVTEHTLFRIASMTKPVTAVAALILDERGLLSLSDPVSKYLPAFSHLPITEADGNGGLRHLGYAEKDPVLSDLLTHTSGIGSDENKLQLMTAEDKVSLDASLCFYASQGLDFEPGTRQQYSGTAAFDVMAKICELLTGKEYGEFLRDEIFRPCGMTETGFVPTNEQWTQFIAVHNKADGQNIVSPAEENCVFADFPCTHPLGGAGLFSTLHDYSRFARMLLAEGSFDGHVVLSPESVRKMGTCQVSKEIMPGNEHWGLGVRVITGEGYETLPVTTFGWSGAYGTHFWVDPVNNTTAVYMKNSLFDGGAGNESARMFEKAVHDAYTD